MSRPPDSRPQAPARKPPDGLRHPLLSVLLALVWLLLQQSLALPQLIVAALLGWGLPRLLHGFLGSAKGAPQRAGRAGVVVRLGAVVLWDILRCNVTVARLVLGPTARPRPAWVRMPLALRHPGAISLLATVITTTPGTVSCVVDEAQRQLLIHVLDCDDPALLVADIQQRYEQPIREIFE